MDKKTKNAIALALTLTLFWSFTGWARGAGAAAARDVLLAASRAHGSGPAAEGSTASGTLSLARAGGAVEECSILIRSAAGSRSRSEVACPLSGSSVYVTDGLWGWSLRDGRKSALPLSDTANRGLESNPALGLLDLFARGRVEADAALSAEGGRLRRVSARVRGALDPLGGPLQARPVEIDVDAATSLVAAVRVWEYGRDGRLLPEPEETRFSEWRRAGGLLVPFRVETVRYGTLVSVLRLNSFAAARHADSLFAEP